MNSPINLFCKIVVVAIINLNFGFSDFLSSAWGTVALETLDEWRDKYKFWRTLRFVGFLVVQREGRETLKLINFITPLSRCLFFGVNWECGTDILRVELPDLR